LRRKELFRACPPLKQQLFMHDLVIDSLEVSAAHFVVVT
jgi:hypothetical protein